MPDVEIAVNGFPVSYDVVETYIEFKKTSGGFCPEGSWNYIPLGRAAFEPRLRKAIEEFRRLRGRPAFSFLEVGCGFGLVTDFTLRQYSSWFRNSVGFDINPNAIELSRKVLLGEFEVADAMTFPDYDKYDIVYFYQPFKSKELEKAFCNKIAKEVKGLLLPEYGLTGALAEWSDNANYPLNTAPRKRTGKQYTYNIGKLEFDFMIYDGQTQAYIQEEA